MTAAVTEPENATRLPLWRTQATAVEVPPADALTLEEVASRTGLKARTLTTAMLSNAHGQRSTQRSLSRPRYDVGGVPYWAPEQVADYFEQAANRYSLSDEDRSVPLVSPEEAVKMQATSLRGLQRLSGVPIGTLHRWKVSPDFPRPVAIMKVDSPTPRKLYSWDAFKIYAKARRTSWLGDHPEVDLDDPAKIVGLSTG